MSAVDIEESDRIRFARAVLGQREAHVVEASIALRGADLRAQAAYGTWLTVTADAGIARAQLIAELESEAAP
jgi:hypothetical protein